MSRYFDYRYEIDSIYRGMQRDLQKEVGQIIPWFVYDKTGTTVDDIYDTGSIVGGRAWFPPIQVPCLSVIAMEGQDRQNQKGLYIVNRLKIVMSARAAERSGLEDLVTNPELRTGDRIVYENKVYKPVEIRVRGVLTSPYAVIGIDAVQVMPDEMVNDPQFADILSGGALPAVPLDLDFPDSAAFAIAIPNNPVLDPNNIGLVNTLSVGGARNLACRQFAIARYVTSAADPVHSVANGKLVITAQGDDFANGDFGFNDLALADINIPVDAVPPLGSDGSVVLHNISTGFADNLFQFTRTGGIVTCTWGGRYRLDGDGSSRNPAYAGNAKPGDMWGVTYPGPLSRGTGSGMVADLGLVRVSEMQTAIANDAPLPHAMVFSSDSCAGPANSGPYRWPATTTDGNNFAGSLNPIEQGTRFQLDPTLNVDDYALNPGQRVLFKTLQKFGAYCIDIGGARIAIYAESAHSGDPWSTFGFDGEYPGMGPIPWDRMRALAQWHGGGGLIFPPDPSLS